MCNLPHSARLVRGGISAEVEVGYHFEPNLT